MKWKGYLASAGVAGAIGVLIFFTGYFLAQPEVFGRHKAAENVWILLCLPAGPVIFGQGTQPVLPAAGMAMVVACFLMFVGYALLGAVIYRYIS